MLNAAQISKDTDLVLVHGWGMNAAVWGTFADGLAGWFRLSLLELPGHGAHPFERAATSLEDWAEVCLDAAPASAIWLGWSLGAMVAIQAALIATQRIDRLILVGGTPRFVRGPDWSCAMAQETLGQFRDNLGGDSHATLARFLALQVRGAQGAAETLRALRRRLAAAASPQPEALEVGLDLLQWTDLRARLGELTCPSLWLLGERDTLVPSALAERLPEYISGGRIRSIPGAGHAPFLSHPEAVFDEIWDFLGGRQADRA